MNLTKLAYDLCQRYVQDQKGLVSEASRLRVLGWIRSRNLAKLCTTSEHISGAYSDLSHCRFARQVEAFFKKNKSFAEPERCEAAAQSAFERAERLCRITNRRLDWFHAHPERMDPEVLRFVERAERIIADVLGDVESFMAVMPELIRITSGASSTRSRRASLPYQKVRIRHMPATRSAIPYLRRVASFYGYDHVSFKEVVSNRVVTVPKNWKTDRTIACEPEGNLFLQLAFDEFVKSRLKRKLGIDLSDQFENQQLARSGSIDDSLATVDLSMASDTVSLNAVHWLFPRKWSKLLIDIRCPFGRGFGNLYSYSKLSSMGNGATFGVETLIFAALSRAVGAKVVRVYGDDIIIDSQSTPALYRLLRFLGFHVNLEKSFSAGPFRESCGKDWFRGEDVTPFYLRVESSMKVELCHLVNGLAPLSFPGGRLEAALLDIVFENKLPLVPWNGSSISGVWVTAHDAYAMKLIHNRRGWVPSFLAFMPKRKGKVVRDSRTLFLWHLFASRRENDSLSSYQRHYDLRYTRSVWSKYRPPRCIISSWVPHYTSKYRRGWVSWHPPAMATPGHLYWWSDSIIRRKAGNR